MKSKRSLVDLFSDPVPPGKTVRDDQFTLGKLKSPRILSSKSSLTESQ